jgi:hypothetical protein
MKLSKKARIGNAKDACRTNAIDTVLDRFGKAAVETMSFNDYINAVDSEALAQAGYFAGEHGITREELVKAMNIAE